MKLHLNLTLRRAVLAAMAMVALHTAEAAITTEKGNMYITGVEAPSAAAWTQAWGANTGVLSVGTSEGDGTLTLDSGTYTTPNAIFLAGKGYDTDGTVANAGIIVVKKGATLTTPAHLNVGNSLVGGNGVLTLEGGTVNAGSGLYVGVNAGWGVINATDATIIVNSAPTGGTGEQQYVFAMGYYDGAGKDNTAVLRNSKISVGTTGGSLDFATIGRGPGKAILDLDKESTADFAAQTLVGEKAGSEGVIFVSGGSKLNLGDTTVLGVEKGAKGAISADAGTVTASDLVIGKAGKGTFTVQNNGSLGADYITAGDDAGSDGTLEIKTKTGTVTAKELLTVGDAGTGTLTNAGTLTAKTIVVGNAETAVGSLTSTGTVTVSDKLYVGYKGTGTITVNDGSLTAGDTYIVGVNSELSTEKGTTTLANATVLGGELETRAGATTNVTGELVMNAGGILSTAGNTNVAEALVHEGTKVEVEAGGSLTTGTVVNEGTVENNGTEWKIKGATTSTVGTVINNGTMNVESSLTTGAVDGEGDATVAKNGSWNMTGQTTQGTVANDGAITLTGNGRLKAGSLTGSGVTTIVVDGTIANGTVITLGEEPTGGTVQASIDTSNAAAIVGKDITFLNTGKLDALDHVECADHIDWINGYINLGQDSQTKLWFTSDYSNNSVNQIKFTKLAEVVAAPADVVVEVVDPESGTTTTEKVEVTLEYEKQTLTTEVKTAEAGGTDAAVTEAIGSDAKVQTVVVDSDLNNTVGGNTSNPTNMVVASGLTDDSSALKVETVVVKQVTTVGGAATEKTAGATGMVLILDGKNTQKGEEDKKDKAHLGFADELDDKAITTVTDKGHKETKKTQTIDKVQVSSGADVELSNLNVHSTHNLHVETGAKLVLDGVNMSVGGSTDADIKTEMVAVETETGEIKNVLVENKNAAHLETGSVIGDAETNPDKAVATTLEVKNGSVVAFEKVYSANQDFELGTTTIQGAKTEVIIDNATLGMDSVVKGEDKEKYGQKIVFSNGSHLKGKGNLKNIHVDKDSYFTVGSSPGSFSASELTVDGKTRFYIITDSHEWNSYTGNSSQLTPTTYDAASGTWGAVSQLVVSGPVTLNGEVTFTYQQHDKDGKFVDCADQEKARQDMGKYFQEGSSIQFVQTAQGGTLTFGSDFKVLLETLPELESGLFWDISSLFTDRKVYVMGEILEEPTRIANTLVSAGETVLNFGRLAESQAALREAGTTRAWASAISNFDSIDNGATTNGYDYSNWGAAVGVDHAFTKNTVLGVAFGCTWGENDPNEGNGFYDAGSIDQDSKMVALYGVHKFRTKGLMNDVKLSAFAAYGWFENDSTRTGIKSGHKATAEWDSDAWVLSASLSRDITTDDGVVFTPYVGVEYTKAGMDDFTEKGKSYDADYTADTDYSNLAVKVGMTVSKTFGSFTPYAGIAYIGDVDRSAAEVTARGKRTIEGKSALPGRDALQLSVGASWQLTESMDLNAGYSAEIRNKATEHNANIGIGLTF